jgi:nicotinate-nucleotide--dimethylbenzimidazole phosphoribosyltransferase
MTTKQADVAAAARARLESLAKPPGSLGRLEALAVRLAETQRTLAPQVRPRTLLLFAGDHGVVAEGVGLWPSAVTWAMIDLIVAGRASSSALARASGADVVLVDAGSAHPSPPRHPAYRDRRVGRGTANLARGPAMSAAELDAAWAVGARAMAEAVEAGARVVAIGEMGIGNTTAAACLAALLTGAAPASVVGPGAGASAATKARKHAVVAEAADRAGRRLARDPRGAIAEVCGYEIAAMAGAIDGGARAGITVVVDGFIATIAALVARRLEPDALATTIASHRGAEPGHAIVLDHLGLAPFLSWELALGEGTGALLLLAMLDAAAALLTEVATLAEVTGGAGARGAAGG